MINGVLHDPPTGPPGPRPPGPPGPRPPPPPGPPGPPKLGRGRAAFKPSRSLSSSSRPLLSESHSANHFSNVPLSSARVREPSLSASAAAKRPGAINLPGPNLRPPSGRSPPSGPPPGGPKPSGGGSTTVSFSANCSWLNLPVLSGSSLSNQASAKSTHSVLLSFLSP